MHPTTVIPPVSLNQPEPPYEISTTTPSILLFSGYTLLNIAFVFSFGTVKLVMALHGYSVAPTVLDYITGVIFAIVSVIYPGQSIHLFTNAAGI